MEKKNAIILAMFGTSVETALPALLNIRDRMVQAFPATPVRISFTSKILCRIWHRRALDRQYCATHPDVPAEVYGIRAPLSVAADLGVQGYTSAVIQPTYMIPAEEYRELLAFVESFRRDNPAPCLAVGRPALGLFESGPSVDDIRVAARALACDVEYARERDAALVYMGHGSKHSSIALLYLEFATAMGRLYPDVHTFVSTVEGSTGMEEILPHLRQQGIDNIILKPFMIVAGNHVRKDMIGPAPRGWKNRLEKAGFTVEAILHGLGEQNEFADIFVRHAMDAAAKTGMELR